MVVWVPAAAWAHPADLGSLEVTGQGDVLTATVDLGAPLALQVAQLPPDADLSPSGITAAAPALFAATLGGGALRSEGQPCAWGAPVAALDGFRIRVRAAARCAVPPGAVRWTLPFVAQMPPTFVLYGRARLDGITQSFRMTPGREVLLLRGRARSRWRGAVDRLARGAALDAVLPLGLALLALGFVGGWRARLWSMGALVLGALGGAALGHAAHLAPRPLALAAALGAAALAVEAVRARDLPGRWGLAALTGAVAGLAASPRVRGPPDGAAWLAGLVIAAGIALGIGATLRWPRVARALAACVLLAALGAGALALA